MGICLGGGEWSYCKRGFQILCPIFTFACTPMPPNIKIHLLHAKGEQFGCKDLYMCVVVCMDAQRSKHMKFTLLHGENYQKRS